MTDPLNEPTTPGVPAANPPAPPQGPPTQTPGAGPPSGGNRGMLVGLVIGLLVAVIAVLGTVLLLGSDDDTDVVAERATAAAPETTQDSPTTTAPAETTTVVAAPAEEPDRGEVEESVRRIENILNQSTEGRAEIISIVDRIQRCAVPLQEADRNIASIIENRNSVLNQISGLRVEEASELNASIDALQRALQASVEANRHYQAWFQWLRGTHYSTYSGQCWRGATAPTNSDYDAATAASGRATNAKQEFTGLFNPLASEFGFRTWSHEEF